MEMPQVVHDEGMKYIYTFSKRYGRYPKLVATTIYDFGDIPYIKDWRHGTDGIVFYDFEEFMYKDDGAASAFCEVEPLDQSTNARYVDSETIKLPAPVTTKIGANIPEIVKAIPLAVFHYLCLDDFNKIPRRVVFDNNPEVADEKELSQELRDVGKNVTTDVVRYTCQSTSDDDSEKEDPLVCIAVIENDTALINRIADYIFHIQNGGSSELDRARSYQFEHNRIKKKLMAAVCDKRKNVVAFFDDTGMVGLLIYTIEPNRTTHVDLFYMEDKYNMPEVYANYMRDVMSEAAISGNGEVNVEITNPQLHEGYIGALKELGFAPKSITQSYRFQSSDWIDGSISV